MRPLTDWELRERDGLLALVTPKWREKRLQAEDPDTNSVVLGQLVEDFYKSSHNTAKGARLLAEGVAAHPNTAPSDLLLLLCAFVYDLPFCIRGFCRNPAIPFLCLEMPDFWERSPEMGFPEMGVAAKDVLHEEAASPLVIAQLINHSDLWTAEAARLHISFAGEVKTLSEFSSVLRDYLDAEAVADFLQEVRQPVDSDVLYQQGAYSSWWLQHLNSALSLPLTQEPFVADPWKRSPLQLLKHLAYDGNRLVRWAAQTRLADPGFVFTWQDDE